jgi:predicted HNH restriction endonuclease
MSPTPEASERQRKAKRGEQWTQETGFPIIASAIERLYRDPETFVSRREIVQLLLHHTSSRKLIERAYKEKKIDRKRFPTVGKYAGNMVDWFSQRWTEDDPKWTWLFSKFRRSEEKIDGCHAYRPISPSAVNVFPDEVEEEEEVVKRLSEGAVFQKLVNAYERNNLARQQCLDEYGTDCYICGFSFGVTYGKVVEGFIHVHHLLQLSRVGKDYKVDPIADLRPVCPNCHAVIHHRPKQPYGIEAVRLFLAKVTK